MGPITPSGDVFLNCSARDIYSFRLGIPDLQHMNMCLLALWISRYHLSDNPMWKKIVDKKYKLSNPNLFCCPDTGASPFWNGVLEAKQADQMGYMWCMGNGKLVGFGRTNGLATLAIQYWPLYVFVNEKG